MTPRQLKKSVANLKKTKKLAYVSTYLRWDARLFEDQFQLGKGRGSYKNYNLDKQGEGMWWRGTVNPNREEEYDFFEDGCGKHMFWAKKEEAPTPDAVSPKILAGYAYDSIKVPDTRVTMKPEGKSTVNLPTWMWLDKAEFNPIEVTATLPGTGLSATTTAKPVSLHLDPGTKDARVHPSSGKCPISKSGSIGTPYKKGNADKTPPCGVTYERATTNSPPHKLKATLTWEIDWEGSNGQGGNLPDGAFDTTQNITVQEVQTHN